MREPVNFYQSINRGLSDHPQSLAGHIQVMPTINAKSPPINSNPGDLRNPNTTEQPIQPLLVVNPTGSLNTRDENHYAFIVSLAATMVNIGSINFLTTPQGRRNFLAIRNTSATANIYLDFGKDATTNSVFKIAANGTLLFDAVVPQDDLYMIGDGINASFSYNYSNISN